MASESSLHRGPPKVQRRHGYIGKQVTWCAHDAASKVLFTLGTMAWKDFR